MTSAESPELEPVAVFGLGGSVGLVELIEAAEDCCRLLIVNAEDAPWSAADRSGLEGLVDYVDLAGLPMDRLSERLADLGVAGMVTFSDELIPTVAAAAGRLGLPFHTVAAAEAVTRKDVQRRLLADAGVQVMRHTAFDTAAELEAAAQTVGFPAVLKPTAGNGSFNVFPAADLEELRTALQRAEVGESDQPVRFHGRLGFDGAPAWQLEERLPDGAHPAGPWLGDYVSVETLNLGADERWHFWIADRLPLLPPFREHGTLGPTLLPNEAQAEVCALASAALRALGVTSGITHTEIKLTPDGPRIIEVNGRVGGMIPALLRQVTDLDVVRLALHAALGAAVRLPVRTTGHSLSLFVQAPCDAVEITRIADPELLKKAPAVWRVDVRASVGARVDYRSGLLGRIQNIWLTAASAAELRSGLATVEELLAEGNGFRYASAPEGDF